ncbi:hypothetical protein ACX800_13810 [Paenarthrobacter nitroguajacolicus]|uniref:hypothetical protein n=1 Tax=Paenarthrobacter nitroguajacolicus TaxID=211146 RepID=UPI003D20C9BF
MKTLNPSRVLFLTLFPSVLAIAVLGGCAVGAPAPADVSATAEASPTASQNPSLSGRLDAATEDLSWDNGNRILGDENGGHTPDIASSLTDPAAGWQGDYTRMVTDGVMTFTSENTQCKVRTIQVRNQPSELVPGDDRASTLKVLAILIPGKTDLAAKAKDATLGYGMAGNREVDMLSLTYTSGDAYGYTAVRTFSKPAVTLKVEALCPTLDTLKSTLPEISKSITINAS